MATRTALTAVAASATRLTGTFPVPWFCVPGSPRVCLCLHQGASYRPLATARTRLGMDRIAPLLLGDNMGLRGRPINGGMVPTGPPPLLTDPYVIGRIRLAFAYQRCDKAPLVAGKSSLSGRGQPNPPNPPLTAPNRLVTVRIERADSWGSWRPSIEFRVRPGNADSGGRLFRCRGKRGPSLVAADVDDAVDSACAAIAPGSADPVRLSHGKRGPRDRA